MSNGSKNQGVKTISRNFNVDYRNAKYQGQISEYERLPQGMGMLLSIDYLVVIAKWEDGVINGECALFYPNGSIFYGNIVNNQQIGLCAYQISKYRTIYSIQKSDEQSLVISHCQLRHTLTLAKIPTGQINRMMALKQNKKVDEIEWVFDSNDRLNNRKIEMLEVRTYSSEGQKWQMISKFSGQVIKNEMKGFKPFVKHHFNTRVTPKDKRLQIIQTKEYVEIRYKKAGIVCRIGDKSTLSNRVKLMGYYDCYAQECDVFFKSKEGIQPQFQEYCEGHSISYGKDRPSTCRANLLTHLRKSINFINRFISLQQLDHLKKHYYTVDQLIDGELSMKTAQLQLEMGKYDVSPAKDSQEKHKVSQQSFQALQLLDIKNDIYSRVNRKKSSNVDHDRLSPLKNYAHSRNESTKSRYRQEIKENYDYSLSRQPRYNKYQEEVTSKHSKQYLKYTQSSPTVKSRHQPHKNYDKPSLNQYKYSYLPKNENHQPYQPLDKSLGRDRSHLHIDLHQIKKEGNYFQKSQNQIYSYHRKEQHQTNFHNESLGTLTHNYQRLNSELKEQKHSMSKRKYQGVSPSYNGTPTPRSPSRYNYLKSPVYSPSGGSAKSKRQWR